jgi:hypothetical protein
VNPKDQRKFAGIERLLEKEVPKLPLPPELGPGPEWKPFERREGGGGRGGGGGGFKKKGGKKPFRNGPGGGTGNSGKPGGPKPHNRPRPQGGAPKPPAA